MPVGFKDWIRLIEAQLSGRRVKSKKGSKGAEKGEESSTTSMPMPISIVDDGDREEMKVEIITHALLGVCV